MSAQGSPYASGSHPPHREHTSKGAKPLRRTSDRIESWFLESAERHEVTRGRTSNTEGAQGGAEDAIQRAQASWTDRPGSAIRLDSGDLGALAARARSVLDGADLPDVGIVASGGLDEYSVNELVSSGAPIDIYAVGTRMGVSADAPYLDSAYKMVEYDGRPVMKLSSAKVTAPGQKQVFRCPGYADVIGLADEPPPENARPSLETVMQNGGRTGKRPTLGECRERFAGDLAALPPAARRIRAPVAPRTTASPRLSALADRVRRRIEEETRAIAARPRNP